ncbi:NADH-ubiquinone oxidoreductase 40 kDa subunit [Penicillium herquei]|nr:NADH-ubiquinone oxidoreductase 40 kDa subunit [Penicillium herquei]
MQKSRAINSALGARAFAPAPRVSVHIQRRNLQDVAITRTGKPILKVQGGRSALGGIVRSLATHRSRFNMLISP